MIDERLYSIGPKLQKKLEFIKKTQYTEKATMETVIKHHVWRKKPFYDLYLYGKHEFENCPYNPEQQAIYRVVYERDDTISKEEFEDLRKFHQVQYVLYHQWKKGEISEKQLKDFNWIKLMFPEV